MREHLRRLRASSVYLFRLAWSDYAEVKRRHSDAEAWRRNYEMLRQSWEAYMHAVLSPTAWLSLSLLLERQRDLRWCWIRPGGYLFTKAGNRRQIIKEKLRPRGITVNLRDRLTCAEQIYHEALDAEIFDFSALTMITLALSGAITGGSFSSSAPHIGRKPMRRKHKRWRLWPPSRSSSLRYLKRAGFLQQLDDEGPRL